MRDVLVKLLERAVWRPILWETVMNKFICRYACVVVVLLYLSNPGQLVLRAQSEKLPHPSPEAVKQVLSVNPSQLEWTMMVPALGKQSPMRAVIHENPGNHGLQFLIRMPPNFHVPAHFHGVNETHTVIEGTFIVQVNHERTTLGPGGFNYTPAQVVHEAWTPPNEGCLIFVTVDGPYDLFPVTNPAQAPATSHP